MGIRSYCCIVCDSEFLPTNPASNGQRHCSIECRFWSKVKVTASKEICWNWGSHARSQSGNGYGSFVYTPDRHMNSSKAAWVISHGEVADGLHVLHKCDNVLCCNPDHLFLGTHQDNMDDMRRKGRYRALPPEHYEKLRLSKIGVPRSAETKKKLSIALIGRTVPGRVVAKVAASNTGKKRSPESIARMSAAQRLRFRKTTLEY